MKDKSKGKSRMIAARTILAWIASGAGVFSCVSTGAQSFLTNGLVAYYPFAGNAQDQGGNGHHGIVTAATLTTDRFGRASQAYYFNGAGAFIAIPNDPALNLVINYTLSLWLSQPAGGIFRILDKKTEGYAYADGWVIDTGYPGNFCIRYGGGSPIQVVSGNTPYTPNQWHHVAVTMTGGTATIYLDGDVNGSGPYGPNPTNSLDLYIGRAHPNNVTPKDWYFHGSVDDVRIYNRAFTPAEVKALYEQEVKPPPRLSISRAVRLDAYVETGKPYRVEYSNNLTNWFPLGTIFQATNDYLMFYFDVTSERNFWRLKESP
jgi:hypothetical protein